MFNATAAYCNMIACLASLERACWSTVAVELTRDQAATVAFFEEIGEEQTGVLVDIATEGRAR